MFSIVLLLGIAAAIIATWSTHKPSQQQVMESLVEYVVKNGRMGMVTAEGLAYFQLPTDDLRVKHVTIRSDNGGSKSIQLHLKRGDERYNIFFVDVRGETTAYFYLASIRGELIKAAYLDPEPTLSLTPTSDSAKNWTSGSTGRVKS
jgi:hypothetical protein